MLIMRERWSGLLGAFVAVAVGSAVVSLSTLLYASGEAQVPARFVAAPIVVRSPAVSTPADPFPESRPWSSSTAATLVARLAALPGVATAVPDREFYLQVLRDGRPDPGGIRGQGWASSQLAASTAGEPVRLVGRSPRTSEEVVLGRSTGVEPGATVTLLTAAGPRAYTVSGVVDGPGIYLSDPAAAALSPGVRAIGLVLAPGVDEAAVAAAARTAVGDDGTVLTGDARSALEPRADARTRWIGMQVLTALAVLAAFVTVFVVAATFSFDVNQRRRELGLLRTIGATPGQVRRMLAGEALAVGGVAALVGVAGGALLAPAVGALLVEVGFEPSTYEVRFLAWPILASLAVGPVVALGGVGVASRRAGRVAPLEAVRTAAVEQRPMTRTRWAFGLLCAAVGMAAGAAAGTAGGADVGNFVLLCGMALVVAAAVLAPAFIGPLVWLLTWPFRGATAMVVRASALTAPRRVAGCAAPVLLTVAFAVMVSGLVQSSTDAYAARRADAVRTGAVVVPDGGPGLTDAAVAATPGLAMLPTTVYVGRSDVMSALGVDVDAFVAANRRLDVRGGTLADLRDDDTVAVTEEVADRWGWRPGGSATVTLADGETVPLRVVAVVSADSMPAGLLLSRTAVRRHDPSALTMAIMVPDAVTVAPGAGARVVDVETYAAEADAAEDRLVWLFTLLLIGVSAGYGAIAVANTLFLAAVTRRRDHEVLRLSGATRGQVARVVALEAVLAVATGAVLGGAVALVALLGVRRGLSAQVNAPVDLVVPWPVVGGVVALCLALAVVASVLPVTGRRAAAC